MQSPTMPVAEPHLAPAVPCTVAGPSLNGRNQYFALIARDGISESLT
jgi:hypothetical protein